MQMKIGDIVVVPMPNNKASFLTKVVSDAKWDKDAKDGFHISRKVERISKFNNSGFDITQKSSTRWSNAGVHIIRGMSLSSIPDIIGDKAINLNSANPGNKRYVFVIDEINRGEISKIFGELFFSIDPDYRGKKGAVKTQYASMHDDPDEKFYVPENVYIIGTMNDIDRSVESFDFAMRRRFRFIELTAEKQGKQILGEDSEAYDRMKNLNDAIEKVDGLDRNYDIGPAYFMNVSNYEELWNDRLEPLLLDYLHGTYLSLGDQKKKLEDFRKIAVDGVLVNSSKEDSETSSE
jgi:hypothetical protein